MFRAQCLLFVNRCPYNFGGVHTIDGLHVVAFVVLGLTIGHGVLAIAEHYFPRSEAVVAGRFILGGAA